MGNSPRHCERSEAIQGGEHRAGGAGLLRRTEVGLARLQHLKVPNLGKPKFGAPRNDGWRLPVMPCPTRRAASEVDRLQRDQN
jgi:hypothetical protein